MSIRIRLIGDLRRFVESDVVEIGSGGCSVAAAFDAIIECYPRLGRELFDDQGRLHYAMVLKAGGRRLFWPQDRSESIEDGGELMLTRFHSGG